MNTQPQLQSLIAHFHALPIISDTLTQLHKELPAQYCYHTSSHTEEVLAEALLFGLEDNLCYQDLYLIALAATFHDTGFLVQATNNEAIGATFARTGFSKLPTLSSHDQETICQMILDTTIQNTERGPKQIATTRLSGYLLDADVSNFGRLDFFEKSELVRIEIGAPEKVAFLSNTLKLLEAHEWYSTAAKQIRFAQKECNLIELRRLLSLK